MDRYHSMQVFVRVAELESFTKAAESLGQPKATISTSVQQLEALMGTRLFQRTTRKVQLTQDGMLYYERCKDLLADIDQVESMFQQGPQFVTGRLRVDMPSGVARLSILPHLGEFLALYPKVEVELSSTDRRVDVIREGFDCVIRVGNLQDSGLMVKKLGEFDIKNVVSPEYLKKYGKPKGLEDLSKHHLIHYVPNLGARSDGFEYYDDDLEKYRTVKMKGAVTVNNAEAYMAACLAGLGIIQAPAYGMKEAIQSGRLVEVLPKLKAEPMPVSFIYPHRRNLPRRVQVFMEWAQQLLQPVK